MAQLTLVFGQSEQGPDESSFPVAYVSLARWTTDESREAIYVSPACINVQELEAAVDSLHRQLESVLAEGRQRFSRA